jgi:hypothetical protein
MTYLKLSTDDRRGIVKGYLGEGNFTADPLPTFGGVAVTMILSYGACSGQPFVPLPTWKRTLECPSAARCRRAASDSSGMISTVSTSPANSERNAV